MLSSPPKEISVQYLDERHIDAFLALRDSLPEAKKKYVKPRTRQSLKEHLCAPMPMIGVFEDDQLVAGALLTFPEFAEHAAYLDKYPLNETTAVLQAVISVKSGMFSHLVEAAKNLSQMRGYTSLIAKIRADNPSMLERVQQYGFKIGEIQDDPLATALCGVHFACAAIGFGVPEFVRPAPDLLVSPHPTEVRPMEYQPAHTG
jgi:hypothetical protein